LPSVSLSNNNVVQNNVPTNQSNIEQFKANKKQAALGTHPQNEVTDAVAAQELITKRGDTLSSVARDLQVDGVSLDQMLVGLYESNQAAFTGRNMNRLKVGQIIKVPTKESLVSVSPQEARKSVKLHSTNWNVYRNNLAGMVSAAPEMLENEQKQSVSGKISSAEDKAKLVKVGPQDVVKLSAGDKDSSKALQSKVIALQEETTAREKALKEAEARTLALEIQIADMQKLLTLKNQSVTDLQKNAEAVTKVREVTQEAKVNTPVQEVSKTEIISPIEEKTADSAPIVKSEVKKSEHQLTPAVKPQAEPSLFEDIMNSVDLTVVGGATGIALLGAGWMFLRNKRRKELDGFERGILTLGGLMRANTIFGNTTGNSRASDTSFLTDFAQAAGSMIDTNDVDPIAEAEVYMAYGRDAQAEEILKDAISKEPKRYELHLKLLEMYTARKDTSAFDAIAGELYTILGADDPTWAKVAVLGAVMEPENPLYDVSKMASATSLATQKLDVSDFSDVVTSTTSTNLDFSLGNEAPLDSQQVANDANSVVMQSSSAPENVKQDTSFDLGAVDVALAGDSTEKGAPESLNESQDVAEINTDNSMDFDLGDFIIETPVANVAMNVAEELPTFDATLTMNDVVQEKVIDLPEISESSVSQSPDLDINFELTEVDNEIVLENKSELSINAADHISFDFSNIEETEAAVASSGSQSKGFEANTLDLSSISLDLGETEHELTGAESIESAANESIKLGEFADMSSESPDVNIKLDLVAAYIGIDDKEGARELLEEVIKEGGAQQKLRAQQLIDSLV